MLEGTRYYQVWQERTRIRGTTLHKYRSYLGKFDEFLVSQYDVGVSEFDIDSFWLDEKTGASYPMDRQFIDEYVEWLEDEYQDTSPSMPPQCFRAVKSFFSTLKENGIIRVDPTVGVIPPKFYKSPKGASLTSQEFQKLLNTAYRRDPFLKKYAAIVLLLGTAGLRNRELRYLTVDRLQFVRQLAVIDQGQKTAPGTVGLLPLLQETLTHYLNHPSYKKLAAEYSTTLVFPVPKGRRMKADELIDIVTELALEAGIKKHVTPHTLRRTLATQMYRSGVDPEIIRQTMRHKKIETTTGRYINPDTEEDRFALESFSMVKRLSDLLAQRKGS